MPDKHYDNDHAKAKSRALVRDEIKSTLLGFRKPNDLRVLCLPGRDALEIYQVYDELGIPRHNVTGLEMIPELYREIKSKVPDIDLKQVRLADFVEREERLPYDVISLDFTQNYTEELNDDIINVVGKILPRNFLFHLAVLAKRENEKSKLKLVNTTKIIERGGRIFKLPYARTEKEIDDTPLKDVRSQSFSVLFEAAINYASSEFTYGNIERALGHDRIREILEINTGVKRSSEEVKFLLSREPNTHVATRFLIEEILYKIECHGYEPNEDAIKAIEKSVLLGLSNARNLVARSRRYSYVSESGSPMIGDICFASRCDKLIEHAKDVLGSLGYPDVVFSYFNMELFMKSVKPYLGLYKKRFDFKQQEREFLGSSYKGSKKKSEIEHQEYRPEEKRVEVIEYLKAGFPIKEIRELFPEFTDYQLRGYRAAITAGKY